MRQTSISEMLCGMEPMMALPPRGEVSAERVKEIAMEKINKEPKRRIKRPMGLLIAAVLCTLLLCVSAYAGGVLTGKELAKRDLSQFVGTDVGNVVREEYLDNGIQNGVKQFFFGGHKRIEYYDSGDIMGMDNRKVTKEEYHPNMSQAAAAAYADMVETIAPGVLDTLHEKGYVKGNSSGVERCFCNDFDGSGTIFNGNAVWVDVLMKDGSAYALFLDPEDFSSQGFLYFDAETAPKMYDGVYTAMHNDTLEQYWYDLQHRGGLG